MVKTALFVAGIMLVTYPMSSKAQTNVSITGNGPGSTSSVTVHNSINATNINSSSHTNSQTHIRIETNGQVKTYDSDKPGNVTIQSNDGTATVHVNNTSGSESNTSTATTDNTNNTETQSIPPTPTIKEASKVVKLESKPITQNVLNQVFSLLIKDVSSLATLLRL